MSRILDLRNLVVQFFMKLLVMPDARCITVGDSDFGRNYPAINLANLLMDHDNGPFLHVTSQLSCYGYAQETA